MKINLLLDNKQDILNGFLNIDPFAEKDDRVKGDVSNLDFICDNGEAEIIIANNILEYFHFDKVDGILNHWLSKLKVGGTLVITIYDIDELSRLFYLNRINMDEFNNLVFGKQKKGWDCKKCALNLFNLTLVLENKGYKILKSSIDGFEGVVICQRIK